MEAAWVLDCRRNFLLLSHRYLLTTVLLISDLIGVRIRFTKLAPGTEDFIEKSQTLSIPDHLDLLCYIKGLFAKVIAIAKDMPRHDEFGVTDALGEVVPVRVICSSCSSGLLPGDDCA